MPIDDDGLFTRRPLNDLQRSVIDALRNNFGPTVDVTNASAVKKMIDVGFSLPLDEAYADLDGIYQAAHILDASGDNLDKLLEPFGVPRLLASQSNGLVQVTMKTGLDPTAFPEPFLPQGALSFTDSGQNRFNMTAAGTLPGAVLDASAFTGAQSETLQAADSLKVFAYPLTLLERTCIGHVEFTSTTVSGTPAYTVRIETDLVGAPSTVLAGDGAEKTGFIPTSGVATQCHFAETSMLDAGDYWIRIEITSGEATLAGDAAAGTTIVRKLVGASWVDSTAIENLKCKVWGDLLIELEAVELGYARNTEAGGITGVLFNDGSVVTRWSQNKLSFTNLEDFGGGRDLETDQEYRQRFIDDGVGAVSGTPDGIRNSILEIADACTVIENTSDEGGREDLLSTDTGTADVSETVDAAGATTRLAWKITMPRRSYFQHVRINVDAATAAVGKVRLETDAAGSPSGILVNTNFERTGMTIIAGQNDIDFIRGDIVASGVTVWVVLEATSGSFILKATTTASPADLVKVYTSSAWVLSARDHVWNLVEGGVPPGGYRAYVSGGSSGDIAQAQWDTRSAGIRDDGELTGTATDTVGREQTKRFERPTFVPLVVHVKIRKDPDAAIFAGDEDDVRDVIIGFIGGIDTQLDARPGLQLSQKFFIDQLSRNLVNQDLLPGSYDVMELHVGIKDTYATPADALAAGALTEVNLTPAFQEEYIIEDVGVDIDVVLEDEPDA